MWRVLGFGRWGMTKHEEGLADVARHGDVNMTSVIVPINFEAKVGGA